MKTKIHIRKNILKDCKTIGMAVIIITILFAYSSCLNNNKGNEKPEAIKKDTLIAPVTVLITNPITINLDTCPPPQVITIPKKLGSSYIKQTTSGSKIIKLVPPETKPASFFIQMQNYNTEQGLSLSGVFCGYKDKTGNLWFGTDGGGVVRYDGKNSTNYTAAQGLVNNVVAKVMEDKIGNMWFGTDGGGISRFDGKVFTNYNTANGLPNNSIRSLMEDENGNIWVGTNKGGLSRLNNDKKNLAAENIRFTNFDTAKGLKNESVMSVLEDRSGNLWFGTVDKGVFRLKKNNKNKSPEQTQFTNITAKQGLVDNSVSCMIEDKDGNIWFGTNGEGISRLNQNEKNKLTEQMKFTNFNTSNGLTNDNISVITEDKNGNIWFGTQGGGVSCYNPLMEKAGSNPFVNYTTKHGLANNDIRSITEDKSGNIWFGTYGGGVSILNRNGGAFTNYTTAQGLADNTIFSIMQDKNENLWFGTYGGGVSRLSSEGKFFTNYARSQGLADIILCITEDRNGAIWFGSDSENSGVFRLESNGKKSTNYTTNQGLGNNKVRRITEDKNGNIWFGTSGGGVSKLSSDRKTFTNYTTTHGLVDNTIWSIVEDKNGNIWFGTQGGGVSRLNSDGKSFTNFTKAQGLADNFVVNIYEDKSGNVWFATAAGGISRYDGKSFINYTTSQGLPDNVVTQILEDENGKIWIGTNKGICGLNFKTSSAQQKEKENRTQIIPGVNSLTNEKLQNYIPLFDIYNPQTGYSIKDVNGGQQAMYIDNKGIIWIGAGDDKTGLIRFNPSININHNPNPLSIFIHSIKINEENICWNDLTPASTSSATKSVTEPVEVNITEEITTFGRVLTDDERIEMRKKFEDVHFDSIGRFYPIPQNLILSHNHNNITINFAAVEPAKPFLVNYQYILEGYDKEWSPVTNKSTATFGNIYEGTYTFKLKAQSPDGVWSEPISYSFKVLPPWYRTWWMYSVYGILSITLIVFIVWWNGRRLRARAKELSEEVRRATATIVEKNKELEKLSIVASETINGVFITDAKGELEWFNEGFSKLFGWESIEEYKKERGATIFDVSGNENIDDLIKEAIRQKKSITYENATPSKNQDELWIQTALTPIFNQEGELTKLVFVETDISELKKSEEQYIEVNKELEAFSYSVSHDLRAPLRAINGYSRILEEDYISKLDADGVTAINAILKNSKKMGELIDDLLAFSRLGRTEEIASEIDMNALVQSILEEEMSVNVSKIEFKTTALLSSNGARVLIKQVWVNLISNAIKYSKDKPKPKIEIGSYIKDNFIVYYVKDNGAGFDMQYYDKLFGVFQRLHSQEEFEGTGIGLAIVQKIVQRHNGTVWAESKLNEGACFYFSLPK